MVSAAALAVFRRGRGETAGAMVTDVMIWGSGFANNGVFGSNGDRWPTGCSDFTGWRDTMPPMLLLLLL